MRWIAATTFVVVSLSGSFVAAQAPATLGRPVAQLQRPVVRAAAEDTPTITVPDPATLYPPQPYTTTYPPAGYQYYPPLPPPPPKSRPPPRTGPAFEV